MVFVLYNPLANNKQGKVNAEKLKELLGNKPNEFRDITKIGDYRTFFGELSPEDEVIIAGGDGTLNRFVNAIDESDIKNRLLYYPAGSGNDFMKDMCDKAQNGLIELNGYIRDLPTVTVGGKKYRFINGIGYGIDGYCCEVGDALQAKSDKPVNYTSIAIKGLLFHYKPVNAKVTVDGVVHTYKKVWLAPTMNGRFYGGGMMVAPGQDRLSAEHKVSTVIMFGSGKLKTLMVFPSIFKGEHVAHKEMVEVLTGHEVTVEFDNPTALQIDGETILGVTSYSVSASVPAVIGK